MQNFREENDLKPDLSDRPTPRTRSRSTGPRFALPRQHMIIGAVILVLMLLIAGIGTALKAPPERDKALPQKATGDINLSDMSAAADNRGSIAQPRSISGPAISPSPTEASVKNGQTQQRVELPGKMIDALPSKKAQMDAVVQHLNTNDVNSATAKSATVPKVAPTKARLVTGSSNFLTSLPSKHYTLQLSSASRPDTLKLFANHHKLKHFVVYETERDGKPWYVLVSGNYASPEDARQAITTLPVEIQAKKPWIRSVQQVQQDVKK